MYLAFPCQLDQQTRTQALKILADSSLVRKMDHHPLVYYLPEAFERLHFLYHTPRHKPSKKPFMVSIMINQIAWICEMILNILSDPILSVV